MFETVIASILCVGCLYLAAGFVLLIPIHRRALPLLDPATRDAGLAFKVMISPGLVALWPLLLYRWRRHRGISLDQPAALPSSGRNLNVWRNLLIFSTALIIPAALIGAVSLRVPTIVESRSAFRLPSPPVHVVQPGPGQALGRLFPSLPATFQRARNIGKDPGLLLKVEDGATLPPTSIYWSPELNSSRSIPQDAVYVATVWGSEDRWMRFTVRDMWSTGYWLAYSHAHQRVEVYATRGESSL